jgi:hypothetical protein
MESKIVILKLVLHYNEHVYLQPIEKILCLLLREVYEREVYQPAQKHFVELEFPPLVMKVITRAND